VLLYIKAVKETPSLFSISTIKLHSGIILVGFFNFIALLLPICVAFAPRSQNIFLNRPSQIQPSIALKMSGEDIDGKAIAATIRGELKERVSSLRSPPGLAVILVGARRDSQTYVRMKKKACEEVGIQSFGFDYPDTVTEDELLQKIAELNSDDKVHGILVQLPLPKHINEDSIIEAVHPTKDVDGLHPRNNAALCSTGTHVGAEKIDWTDLSSVPFHIPCTPQGCIELLDRSGVELKGKNAVVIGRSNLVGLPVAMLLMHRDATVTIVHSKTTDAPGVVGRADVVVAAVGRAEMVKKEWIKEGAVVIDVGINSVDDASAKRGYRLVGDVDYAGCKEVASKITPVPGGVGPMTIAMLLRNTVNSCVRSGATKGE
jgi:5,10-methylene-tetrahydrofolate dehydrogenase/methenyl tetrahydrofolate cyclohydrolase